jgi:hypothetical protein
MCISWCTKGKGKIISLQAYGAEIVLGGYGLQIP